MNFAEAFLLVLQSKVGITRDAWDPPIVEGLKPPHVPCVFAGAPSGIRGPQAILTRDKNQRQVPSSLFLQTYITITPWFPTNEDLFAEDWQVVEIE